MLLLRNLFGFARRKIIFHNNKELTRIHTRAPKLPLNTKPLHSNKHFTASLIGLPNSGKSTLFNAIVGEQLALTDSMPGMTRDRKEATIWGGLLKLIDTAGVESVPM